MAAQTLKWSGNGSFIDATRWQPAEAPTPNTNQTLQILSGTVVVNNQPWSDYNLVLSGTNAGVVFVNQTLDAASTVRQAALLASIGVEGGNGLTSFADISLGASGAQVTTSVTVANGSLFRNNGSIDIDGSFLVGGGGAFVNNGTFAVENGTAQFAQLASGLVASSFVIGENGTLEYGGVTNGTISFAPDANGQLRLNTAGAQNGIGAIKGFNQGDSITFQGQAVGLLYQPATADSGALVVTGPGSAEIARIPFSGAYQTANFGFATADGRTTITSNLPEAPPPPPSGTVITNQPVLDLDNRGRRDAQVTVNGPNDVTLAMTGLTIRDTALSRAEFLDGSLVFDGTSPNGRYVADVEASQIARMYYTVLGRGPEFVGARYWVENVMEDLNFSIEQVAPFFYESREFKARYGENTTNQQFVSLLYQNVLGRAGDPEGVAYWTNLLASGTGRAQVVVSFSESFEHQAARYDAIERNGIVFLGDPYILL